MTDAATAYFASAAEIQKRPITEPQWADAVEAYQRAKLIATSRHRTNRAPDAQVW